MPIKEQKNDWRVFKIFERMGFVVAFFISWIVLISAPLDILFQYISLDSLLYLYYVATNLMGFANWLNDFLSYWRDLWQWPIIFYSLFFIVGRIIFKDWSRTNLLIWVAFIIAYLNLLFFNTGFEASNFVFTIADITFYPMTILAPVNTSIYPEFGALLLIAGYDLLKRAQFDMKDAEMF